MATIKCQDCAGRVSTSAECCPHCGNKNFLQQHREWKAEIEFSRKRELKEREDLAKKSGYSSYNEMQEALKPNKFIAWVSQYTFDEITGCLFGLFVLGSIIWFLWGVIS